MKNFYLSISLLIVGFFSQAQINKGAILLGGNFSAGTSSDKPDGVDKALKSTNLSFFPSYGRAIRDNLVLGFDLLFIYDTQAPGLTSTSQTNGYGAGFFVRKYKPLGSGFSLFGQTRLGFNYQDYQTDYSAGTGSQHQDQRALGASLAFTPGIAYAVSRRWQLETSLPSLASINYTHASTL